jgi:ribosomal protein S27E
MRMSMDCVKRSGMEPGRRQGAHPLLTVFRIEKTVQFSPDCPMSNALELICPDCQAAAPPDSQGGVRCAGCGAVLAEPFTFCPQCGRINNAGASVCAQCAEELKVTCPGCGRVNWSGAERCGGCGRELDALAHAFRPISASVEIRRQELIRNVSSFREKEEKESQARLDTLREADRSRAQRSTELAERARLSERRIIVGAVVVIAVFLVFIIAAMAILF